MINLATQESKKGILKEYRFRLFIMSIFAIASLVAVSVILLIPTIILAELKQSSVVRALEGLKKQNAEIGEVRAKEIDDSIKEINRKAILVLKGTGGESLVPSEVIALILEKRAPAIRVDSIMFDVTPDRERFVVAGRAATRDALAVYRDAFKTDKMFTRIDLPIASFVKNTDITFSLTLERALAGAKKKK